MKITPSPAKKIVFADGKTLEMNRAARRRAHIYNRDLTPVAEKSDGRLR